MHNARTNNLRGVDLEIPTESLVVVTGVSGSGKSSLIMDTLLPAIETHLSGESCHALCDDLEMTDNIRRLSIVNQRPIGRSRRSTPATYTKVMDPLRSLFATTRLAKEKGWTKARFSYNAKEGRCSVCEGRGAIRVEMHFLSDVWVRCEGCRGHRYESRTLQARWRGLSISDALELRISDAIEHFSAHPKIVKPLKALEDVGLGYLRLGQPAHTLSGGEAQRIKLATELVSRGKKTLYVLDEPTTGLHLADIEKLIGVMHRLVDAGGTMIVIEHHPDVIKNADHVIDMGPEGGEAGGQIVAAGTPEEVAMAKTHTSAVLQRILE